MICFRTQLFLKQDVSFFDIWKAFLKWRMDSKNTCPTFKAWCKAQNEISKEKVQTDFEDKKRPVRLETIFLSEKKVFGLKMSEYEGKKTYITYITVNISKKRPRLSCEIEVENNMGTGFTPINRPKFFEYISSFLDEGYRNESIDAQKLGVEKLANIMTGKAALDLPIIYLSFKNKNTPYSVNPNDVAVKLFSVAYVCTEPSREFSYQLREATNHNHPYGGTIACYWKENYKFFFDTNANDLFRKVSRYLLANPLEADLSWLYVQTAYSVEQEEKSKKLLNNLETEIIKIKSESETSIKSKDEELADLRKTLGLKDRIIEEKDKTINDKFTDVENERNEKIRIQKEFDDFLKDFQPELDEKNSKIQSLQERVNDLESQLASWKRSHEKQNTESDFEIDIHCSEKALHLNEITDYVKGILYNALKREYADYRELKDHNGKTVTSRTKDVLSKLVDENKKLDFELSESEKKYRALEEKARNEDFNDEAFSLKRQKNHENYLYYNDERYNFPAACSISDTKHGLENNAKFIARKCFLIPRKK